MPPKGKVAGLSLQIMARQTIVLLTIEDCEKALGKLQNVVDDWVKELRSPSPSELFELSEGIEIVRKALTKFALDAKSLEDKFCELQAAYTTLENNLKSETEERVKLESQLKVLTEKVNSMELAENVIFAKSIVSAAQNRLLDKICDGTDEYYNCISDVIYDVQNGYSSRKITENWVKVKNAWDDRLLSRLIRDLSGSRGAVCHAEDRDPGKFASLPAASVRDTLESVILEDGKTVNKSHIKALVKLHCFTATKAATGSTELDEAVEG
eukprot:gene25617-28945_t